MQDELIKLPLLNGQFRRWISAVTDLSLERGPWVAGGSVRKMLQGKSWWDGDVDVWHTGTAQHRLVCDRLTASGAMEIRRTSNASTWELPLHEWRPRHGWQRIFGRKHSSRMVKIQVIEQPYDTISQLFDRFDFTICRFATDGVTIATTKPSLKHCAENQLVYDDTGVNKLRLYLVKKYLSYGFYPDRQLMMQSVDLGRSQLTLAEDDYDDL
jgi:hypothetical protein